MLRPPDGGSTRWQGGARGGRDARRRPWHRGRPGRGGRHGLRDRAQHARPALGGRPARDDRGDRGARRPPPVAPGSRSWSTISSATRSRALVARIEAEQGRLDVLVNDVWGGGAPLRVGHAGVGARPRQRAAAAAPGARDPPHHQPPRAATADRAPRWSADRGHRRNGRVQRRPLPQLALLRPGQERGDQAGVGPGPGARAARRHRRRADARVAALGGDARGLRRHRGDVARGGRPGFRTSAARSRRPSSAAPPRPWPPIPTWRAGAGSRCRAAPSRRSTASPTSTAPGPTRGATSSRSTEAGLPADDTGYR